MLGVFVGHACFGWDSGKQLKMDFGENFGLLKLLGQKRVPFPSMSHQKTSPASSGNLFPKLSRGEETGCEKK